MYAKGKLDKKQHIQAFTRIRPLSTQELRSQVVVECVSSKEVTVRDKNQTKTFYFDKVFGPDSKQVEVYKAVVSPLISEVLQGYNCTVFAYGQTGTGKTFTMVGEKSECHNGNWENDPNCGVIPRTLSHLFDELKVRADEFTVRVSFLELYNEELCDLLAPNDCDDGKNLKLFEDSMKKGSVIVSGLEERTVHNKDDVYGILEAGNLRRQTAPTLMNAQSSRSHTIFTITVHIKVTSLEGEDLIKTGKLNLVDLAGSENIGRSGAVDLRAREAGSINQSLLTLGRVITCLVERAPHIPYRESKLTRILQDSLGGRTKTSIIATVSPALCNIEETLSTFDYAHRARNITNKPEINQKTSKRVLLKEYTEEIERLRRDLVATREKHGVYMTSENYNAIMFERENLNKELVSKLQLLKVREYELGKQEEILKNLNMDLYTTQNELAATCRKLKETSKICEEKEDMLCALGKQTNALLKTADEAVNDVQTLHDRLTKSRRILEHNYNTSEKFKISFCWNLNDMKNRTNEFLTKGIDDIESQIAADKKFVGFVMENQKALEELTSEIVKDTGDRYQSILDIITNQISTSENFLTAQLGTLNSVVNSNNQKAHEIISSLSEHALKMKADWKILSNAFETNRKILEHQKSDVEVILDRLTNLTKLTLAVPLTYSEKLREREMALKLYKEKCDFLEKEQMNARKQIHDFGQALLQMAQNHAEQLEREKECEEALKKLRTEKIFEDKNFLGELSETVNETLADVNRQTEEVERIRQKIAASASEEIESLKDVIPSIGSGEDPEEKFYNFIKGLVQKNSFDLEANLTRLKEVSEEANKKLVQFSESVEKKSNDIIKSLTVYGSEMNKNHEVQSSMIETTVQDNMMKKQMFSSSLANHLEELFSGIQERMKEIETFFSEDMIKDEVTGNTPQRKEFRYPKRIVEFSLKNSGSINTETDESKENISSGPSDIDCMVK